MSSSRPVHTLPIVTIQATFSTVVNEVYSGVIPAENIWISCYNNSPNSRQSASSSLHAKVRVILDDEDREKVVLQTREGDVSITEAEHREFSYVYAVSSPSLHISSTKLLFPMQEYADPERSNPQKPHRITAFALAPDKSQYTTGYLDGSVYLYPSIPIATSTSPSRYPTSEMYSPPKSTYTTRRQILVSAASASSGISQVLTKAHKSTVTSLRFFPSSRVLLSSGADFTLQIYPADPIALSAASSGSTDTSSSKRVASARTLIAHTRSVTSTAMIGRGRAIISASLDGTIRIWDVSSGKEETLIHSAAGVGVGVNRVFLDSDSSSSSSSGTNTNTSTDTSDPVVNGMLYAALNDGSFEVLKLDGSQKPRKLVSEFCSERSVHGALTAITVNSPVATQAGKERYVAVGSAKGVVSVYSTLSSYASSVHFRRSDASIEDLAFVSLPGSGDVSRLGLVVATADGLPWIASLDVLPSETEEGKVSVYAELAGGDVDAVHTVSVHASGSEVEVWTAGDDGIVRRYIL